MARNGSGTYSIPTTFSSGTTISSSAVNANNTDIGSEITNSLPRDGQAAMTGQFKAASGSVAAPGMAFSSDTDTGFYRKAGDTVGIVAGGTEVGTISTSGMTDPNGGVLTAFPTGCMMPYVATSAPTGWVRANGRTIGNASSSATERANADTSTLFTLLWNSYSDSVCAVSSGRGASAAADYAANKTIALPDLRGRSFFGLDDMGSTAASRLGSVITTPTTNGSSGGTETSTIAQANLPNATLTGTTASGGTHTHTSVDGNQFITAGNSFTFMGSGGTPNGLSNGTASGGAHTHTFTTSSINGGVTQTAMSNLPPAFVGTFIIKL